MWINGKNTSMCNVHARHHRSNWTHEQTEIQFKQNTVQHTEQIVPNRMCGKIWPLVIKSVAFFYFNPSRADAYRNSRIRFFYLFLAFASVHRKSAFAADCCSRAAIKNTTQSNQTKQIWTNNIALNILEHLIEMALNSATTNQNLHHKL